MAENKVVAVQTLNKRQVAKPFNFQKQSILPNLGQTREILKLLVDFSAKIIQNLFLGLLAYRFKLCFFYSNTSFELFICYLNRLQHFPGKQLSLEARSFTCLIIRYAFPIQCLSENSVFCKILRGMVIINVCAAAAGPRLLSCREHILFIHPHFFNLLVAFAFSRNYMWNKKCVVLYVFTFKCLSLN